jgi:hypothetical protein
VCVRKVRQQGFAGRCHCGCMYNHHVPWQALCA